MLPQVREESAGAQQQLLLGGSRRSMGSQEDDGRGVGVVGILHRLGWAGMPPPATCHLNAALQVVRLLKAQKSFVAPGKDAHVAFNIFRDASGVRQCWLASDRVSGSCRVLVVVRDSCAISHLCACEEATQATGLAVFVRAHAPSHLYCAEGPARLVTIQGLCSLDPYLEC